MLLMLEVPREMEIDNLKYHNRGRLIQLLHGQYNMDPVEGLFCQLN